MTAARRLLPALAAATPAVRRFLAGSILLGVGVAFFDVLTNLYLQDEGVPKAGIGEVLSQRAVGTVLGALAAGPVLGRRRDGLTFAAASLLLTASMAGLVFGADAWQRAAASTVFGFAVTFRLVGSAPLLIREVQEPWVAAYFGFDAAVIAGTQVAGCGLAAGLYELFAWTLGGPRAAFQATLCAGAALTAASAWPYARMPASAPHAEAAAVVKTWPPWTECLRLALPFFLVGAGAGLTIPYLNLYFEDRFDVKPSTIAVFYAAVAAATTAGYLASPVLARRLGLVKSVVLSEILSIPFFVILAFSQSFALSVAAFLFRGALMNLPYPLYGNFIMRVVKPEERERANAATKLAWNASWVLTSRLAGWILEGETPNYTAVMLTTAGLYLAASASFWCFFRKTDL